MLRNRKIFNLTLTSDFHIDFLWGLSKFNEFIEIQKNLFSNGNLFDKSEEGEDAVEKIPVKIVEQGFFPKGEGSETKVVRYGIVPLKGVLTVEGTWCDYGALDISNWLKDLYNDDTVDEIIMEVNSGGGESQAGYIIKNAIAQRNKPVKVWAHTIASAAYNAVSNSDGVYLSTKVGEAGSIGSLYAINKRMMDEYKKNYVEIYAKQSTEKNKDVREFFKGNYDILFEKATESAQIFIDTIHSDRPNINSIVDAGGMYKADKAIDYGLVDGIMEDISMVVNSPVITRESRTAISNNNNKKEMTIKEFIQLINNKFNLSLSEEASKEQVVEAVNGLAYDATLTENVATLNENVTTLTESLKEVETLKETVKKLEATVADNQKTLTAELGSLKTLNISLKTAKEAAEDEVIKLKEVEKPVVIGSNTPPATKEEFVGLMDRLQVANETDY